MVGVLKMAGVAVPMWLYNIPLGGNYSGSLLSVLFLLFCCLVGSLSTSGSNLCNHLFTFSKLVALLFIIVMSFMYFDTSNYIPFVLPEFGISGVAYGATLIFYGYLGFDFITTLTEEAKDPMRTVPKSVGISVVGSMLIYSITAFSVSGVAKL